MADAQKLYDMLKADKNCKSLLSKALNDKVFGELKDKKSKFGGALADCIRSGILTYDGTFCYKQTETHALAHIIFPGILTLARIWYVTWSSARNELVFPVCQWFENDVRLYALILNRIMNGHCFTWATLTIRDVMKDHSRYKGLGEIRVDAPQTSPVVLGEKKICHLLEITRFPHTPYHPALSSQQLLTRPSATQLALYVARGLERRDEINLSIVPSPGTTLFNSLRRLEAIHISWLCDSPV
ncbi:hypothetical protein RRG08_005092 [Elysia crispata]|uniref:Phosphagen kinase N-terminal domain-containing protein n=1 Tax=Elysia crispata TaxID=231223 RepID=A0AAE1CPS3_9GAST|nr:hypothetical protein RRG08_005092 [Elysia crispata]